MKDLDFKNPRNTRVAFLKANRGRFIEFKVGSSSIAPRYGEMVGWYVISSGKRPTLFKYLFLKWLWDELTFHEWKFVLNLPEFFSSEEFVACARALASRQPKTVIRTRLNNFRILRGLKPLSEIKYRSMKRNMAYTLVEYTYSPLSTKKYSGWTRHHNDHGSLGRIILDPLPSEFTEKLEIDLFNILTVGEVKILNTVFSLSPDDVSKETKRKTRRTMKTTVS